MRIEEGSLTADIGVVSSSPGRLQIDVITVGAFDSYSVLFDEFRLASDHVSFTLPEEFRLCATPHRI
jgi:hypothetical protein